MPESQDFDTVGLSVDLVVEVVASAAQQETANGFLLGIAGSCSDTWLSCNELEGSLEVFGEGKRGCRAVGSPPSRGPPDLCRSAGRRLDRQASGQGLLAKLSEQDLRIDELTPPRLPEGLFEVGFLFAGQLEGLIAFGDEDRDGGSLLE